jgi:hypothetical protein
MGARRQAEGMSVQPGKAPGRYSLEPNAYSRNGTGDER